MTGWQDRENGDAVLDGWYAIMVSWGTPWEEDSPDVLRFKDGEWVEQQGHHLPNFNYFQGPFQGYAEASNWGYANDPVTQYLVERSEAAREANALPTPEGG